MKGKPDPERDGLIVNSFLSGNSIQAISKYYQLTTERVRQILNKAGVRKPKWKWSDTEKVEKIFLLLATGMSQSAIAREVGLSRERIRMIIKTGRKTMSTTTG